MERRRHKEASCMTRETEPVFVSILGYQEEGEWVALALEMDLRGFGKTFEDAFDQLMSSVEAQLSFALYKHEPGLIWHPAEKKYFELFDRVRKRRFSKRFMGEEGEDDEYEVRVQFPDPQVIAQKAASYRPFR